MKKRKTVERWLSDILGNRPDLEARANRADRKVDQRVGAQMREARNHLHAPECDWRRLEKTDTHSKEPKADD